MTNLNINRGFEALIPKSKPKEEIVFQNKIKFKLFKKTISFSIEVK